MKNIRLNAEIIKELGEEFSVTRQTIYMSLKGVYSSQLSKAIRRRAKELLLKEAEKIKD